MGIPLDAVSCHPVMGHGRLARVGDAAHHTAGDIPAWSRWHGSSGKTNPESRAS